MSEAVKRVSSIVVGGATLDILLPVPDGGRAVAGKQDVSFINFETGGGAINVSTVLSRLGHSATASCAIGDDWEGELLCAKLGQSGVSLDGVEIIKGGKTGRAVISIGIDGDVYICADRGANVDLRGPNLDTILKSDLLYITSVPDQVVVYILSLLNRAKIKDIRVAFNPGMSQIQSCRSTFKKLLAHADILLMNASEAHTLISKLSDGITKRLAEESCLALSHLFSAQICVTDGAKGVWIGKEGDLFHQPAINCSVASTVGAGDTFGATFAHFISHGYTSRASAYWAALNAEACLSAYDAVSGVLSENALMERSSE